MAKKLGPKNAPKKTNPFSLLLILALVLAALSMVFSEGIKNNGKAKEVSLSEFLSTYQKDELKEITIKNNIIMAETFDGQKLKTIKEINTNAQELGLNDTTKRAKIEVVDTTSGDVWKNILIGVAPLILLVLFFVYISRKAGGGMGEGGPFGFGKSKAKTYDKSKQKTKFTDVAGCEEAKEDVVEVVDFLKNPKKYEKMGAKIPKGILMVGPPGTGKTLMARAIAGEANVPFFSVSGSEFVEMFVGVGASRVRDLFKTAKQNAPSIIFIDEIDAIGKKRGNGYGGGHDEREQTLNQILTEMDGFESGTNVIVIAATNRPDVLDKALLRPGRFDRRVMIDLPDMEARQKILEVHAKNKILGDDVKFEKIASKTVGFAGADIENVMNEAAIMAVKKRSKSIVHEDLENAVEKVSIGPERRSRRITPKEREIVAYHEAGHAIAGHLMEHCDPVHKLTIIPRGSAMGMAWSLPEEDTYLKSASQMKDDMVMTHGGRVAEMLIFDEKTTGASNDLEKITRTARAMVMTYGMGSDKVGPIVFSERSKNHGDLEFHEGDFSPETARIIDQEVRGLVQEAEDRCHKVLKDNIDILHKMAKDLLEKETLMRDEFLTYFAK